MGTLHAWVEYRDDKGTPQSISMDDKARLQTLLPGLEFERLGTNFMAKTAENRIVLNGRPVKQAHLNHLDSLVWNGRFIVFHASYLPNAPRLAPAQSAKKVVKSSTPSDWLFPWDMLFVPRIFWKKALNQPVSFRSYGLFAMIGIGAVVAVVNNVKKGVPIVLAAYTILSFLTLGLWIMATAGALDLKRPGSFSKSIIYSVYFLPFALLIQCTSAVLALKQGGDWLDTLNYGLFAAGAIAVITFLQTKAAFGHTYVKSVLLAAAFSIPWYALMTGLMAFLL
jgi:hypothetical protein